MPDPPDSDVTRPRRRLLGGGLLIAVLAALMLTGQLSEPEPVAEPEPTPLPAPPDPPRKLHADRPGRIVDVSFADRRQGFALQYHCVEGKGCHNRLLVTDDGTTWRVRGAPQLSTRERMRYWASVHALGGCRVAVDDAEPPAGVEDRRWFSDDCGKTWRQVPWQPRGSVERIPPGAVLTAECRNAGDWCDERVVVSLPDSGQRRWLRGWPLLEEPTVLGSRQADGGWWISGKDPADGRWRVAATHDNGRSWSSRELPGPDGPVPEGLSLVVGRDHAYALVTGTIDDSAFGLLGILHSTDGGQNWQPTRGYEQRHEQPQLMVGGLARPDDLLLLGIPEHTGPYWRSTDHGRTFAATHLEVPVTAPRWSGGGYLAVDSHEWPTRWYRSTDGVRWRALDFPGI